MKQNTLRATVAACVLALALAGCSSSAVSSGSASSDDVMEGVSDQSMTSSEADEYASDASSDSAAVWAEAEDAKEAASGAGLDDFAVPGDDVDLSIGTIRPKDWTFCYTDGIAEADAFALAATVVVREGAKAGDCTTPLSDEIAEGWSALEDVDYDQAWTQQVGDFEVTCFGGTEGVASKMIWNMNQHGFSVQVLGQGDNWDDFGIEEADVEALVGAVIAANSNEKQDDVMNAEDYAEALVRQNGLGELVSYSQYQDENGNWVLEVVTRGSDGNEYRSVIGADGNVIESNSVQSAAVADNGNGQNAEAGTASANDANDSNNADADTSANTSASTDGNTNVKKYSNTQAKQAVQDNNLGTYMYSQEVQGADGNIYQEITTRDEDGHDSYSYLDSEGNVVYDVDVELRYNNDGSATPNKKS